MSDSKWTKTATSASLALLGMTQLNNKAQATIVSGSGPIIHNGLGSISWTLDGVNNGQGQLNEQTISGLALVLNATQIDTGVSFRTANYGTINDGNNAFGTQVQAFATFNTAWTGTSTQYIAFKDTHGPNPPIFGWASISVIAGTQNYTLNQWYYQDNGGGICVGATGIAGNPLNDHNSCSVPFDFNPLEGVALGIPIYLGLRHLKRRKAKVNSTVSIKRKEKVHPLTLLAMGAAGVRKWREQRARDAA